MTVIGRDFGGAHLKAAVIATDDQVVPTTQQACPFARQLKRPYDDLARAYPHAAVSGDFDPAVVVGSLGRAGLNRGREIE
ncbi:MAG: hypothetical protein ACFCUG_05390 [Thiotrichales bacterium]